MIPLLLLSTYSVYTGQKQDDSSMELFNEKTHACIAAGYYARLKQNFGGRGINAFILATEYYAEQRGRRMAQRAIRDGKPLTYAVYQEYGEWEPTQYCITHSCSNVSTVESWSPDMKLKITRCPWHAQFAEMGALEAGDVYCHHLDSAICRGFNPEIRYETPQNLNSSGCCIQIIRNVNFREGETHPRKKEYVQNFEYHCAHSFWSYAKICRSIFLSEGERTTAQVLDDLKEYYGQQFCDCLMKYRSTDFDAC